MDDRNPYEPTNRPGEPPEHRPHFIITAVLYVLLALWSAGSLEGGIVGGLILATVCLPGLFFFSMLIRGAGEVLAAFGRDVSGHP